MLLPLIVVSALPAAMAANFGYHPKFWTDILNPWSTTFTFVEPTFSAPDHGARIAYAMALAVIAMPTLLAVVYTLAVLIALVLSWLATGALGCLSWRMAIATQWAVEPAPEGKHAFFNGGWTRDALALERDRAGLQHSEPYTSPAVVEAVVEFVVEGFRTGADRPHDA